MTSTGKFEARSLATSALIVNLSLSVWTGRKLDRGVSQEIERNKNTKTRVGNYHKNLFAGSVSLEAINKICNEARSWHYLMTQPWGDNGDRLLSAMILLEYKQQLEDYEDRFWTAVNEFLSDYPNLVSAAAFKLGGLFNRADYPDVTEVKSKFGFKYTLSPVPTAGDFRVDIGQSGLEELRDHYEHVLKAKVDSAMHDAWDRVQRVLEHMSERLEDATGGKHKIFRDSLVDNALELCDLLKHFNLTNDPKLEQLRKDLEQVIRGLDGESLRKSDKLRRDTKVEVDTLLEEYAA